MLKLYYLPGACSLVPHIALAITGAAYEAEAVARDQLKSEAFLKLNPLGSVPVLQNDGFALSQNTAILAYLDALYPEAALFGQGSLETQAKARQWLAFANTDLHGAFGTIFAPNRFIDGEGETAQIRERAKIRALSLLAVADEALQGRDYFSGEFTVADVYVYVILRWANMLQMNWAHLANLQALYQRVEAQTSVQQALREQGLVG